MTDSAKNTSSKVGDYVVKIAGISPQCSKYSKAIAELYINAKGDNRLAFHLCGKNPSLKDINSIALLNNSPEDAALKIADSKIAASYKYLFDKKLSEFFLFDKNVKHFKNIDTPSVYYEDSATEIEVRGKIQNLKFDIPDLDSCEPVINFSFIPKTQSIRKVRYGCMPEHAFVEIRDKHGLFRNRGYVVAECVFSDNANIVLKKAIPCITVGDNEGIFDCVTLEPYEKILGKNSILDDIFEGIFSGYTDTFIRRITKWYDCSSDRFSEEDIEHISSLEDILDMRSSQSQVNLYDSSSDREYSRYVLRNLGDAERAMKPDITAYYYEHHEEWLRQLKERIINGKFTRIDDVMRIILASRLKKYYANAFSPDIHLPESDHELKIVFNKPLPLNEQKDPLKNKIIVDTDKYFTMYYLFAYENWGKYKWGIYENQVDKISFSYLFEDEITEEKVAHLNLWFKLQEEMLMEQINTWVDNCLKTRSDTEFTGMYRNDYEQIAMNIITKLALEDSINISKKHYDKEIFHAVREAKRFSSKKRADAWH